MDYKSNNIEVAHCRRRQPPRLHFAIRYDDNQFFFFFVLIFALPRGLPQRRRFDPFDFVFSNPAVRTNRETWKKERATKMEGDRFCEIDAKKSID